MSRILKHGATAAVRPLAGRGDTSPSPDPRFAAIEAQVVELAAELAERGTEIERLRARSAASFDEGLAEGRILGREEAQSLAAERLSLLRENATAAVERFETALQSMERLSALLAVESLSKLIGDPGGRADLVCRIIREQVAALEAAAVLAIEVSRADFDDDAAAREAAGPGMRVEVSERLEGGECRIRLRLGTVDVGVGQQWGRLSELLAEMAEVPAQ